jgi:hypothetical protein
VPREKILVQNCTSVRLSIDGRDPIELTPSGVGRLLSSEVDLIVTLALENRFDASAEPVCQSYEITIKVPGKRAMDDVDRAFVHHLGTDAPHMGQVASFLQDSRCVGIVHEYADALAAYVRGVLIKDQDKGTGVTLRPAEAREIYGNSLGRLQNIARLLPSVICALIRFAMNDFSLSENPTGVLRLDRVISVLAPLVGRKGPIIQDLNSATVHTIALCPIDHGVDRILRLGESMMEQRRWGPLLRQECSDAASAPMIEAEDRQKLLALWATTALRLGAEQDAIEPLRQLRATYPFGGWAERQLERIDEVAL